LPGTESRHATPSAPTSDATAVAVPLPVAESPPVAVPAVAERPVTHARREVASTRQRSAATPRVETPQAVEAPARRAVPPEANGGAKTCAQLARHGASEQALECYQRLAGSAGMTAELALFEQARIEGKVLRRPDRALLTLDDYRRRFPHGSLRGEVMLAQIDWLLAAGDRSRALRVVEEALASGLLRERAAELTRLRGTLGATESREGDGTPSAPAGAR
jgi:hypothetical protein